MDRETADTLRVLTEANNSIVKAQELTIQQTGLLTDASERLLNLYKLQSETVKRQAKQISDLKQQISYNWWWSLVTVVLVCVLVLTK